MPVTNMIFVNLPVTDLAKATAFYQALGAIKNEQFSNDSTASCLAFSDAIHVMLLTHDFFRTFTPKAITPRSACEVLFCVSADSREAVDEMVTRAGAAGGILDPSPQHDHGYMYGRSFEDPDGHGWQVMWMDVAAAQTAMGQAA